MARTTRTQRLADPGRGRRLNRRATAAITAGLMLLGSAAFADNLVTDGDVVASGVQTLDFGSVCPESVTQKQAEHWVTKQGNTTVNANNYANSAVVTFTATGTSTAALSAVMNANPSQVTLPSDWRSSDNNTMSDKVGSTVTLTAPGTAGPFSGTVTYRAAASFSTGTTSRTETLSAAGTVLAATHADCAPVDITAPTNASVVINDNDTWTTSANVSLALAATDNVGVTRYRLAETQAGLGSATDVAVSPATTSFSASNVSFTLTGSDDATKALWMRVYDAAGNSVDASDTIGLDRSTPPIEDNGPTTSPNGAGWYNTDVTNEFEASDQTSGLPVEFTNPFTKTTTGEGTAVKVSSGAVSDVAGNTNNGIDSAAFKVDRTKPTSVVTGITSATYDLGSEPTPGCEASDGLSGVASDGTPTTTGGSGVGEKSVTCNGAIDAAGNVQTVASAAVTYNIVYAFGGFNEPVVSLPLRNVVKAGRAVPIKFSLGGNQGLGIFANSSSTAPGGPRVQSATCDSSQTDVVEDTLTAGSSSLKYDAETDTYNYVWKSDTKWAGKCMTLFLNLNDGSTHQLSFQFTK